LSTRPVPKEPSRPGPSEKPPAGAATAEDDGTLQIWLLSAHGGEPWPLTRGERGIHHFEWADKDTIVFSAEEEPSLYEHELKEKKDDSRTVDDADHTAPVRLFRASVENAKATRLTTNRDWIETWALSPDGKRAVAVHQRSLHFDFDEKELPVVILHDLTTGASEPIFTDLRIVPLFARWAPDGSGVYAVHPFSKHPVFHQAFILQAEYWDLGAKKTRHVDLHWDRGLASDFEPDQFFQITQDGFLTLLADGFYVKPAFYAKQGDSWKQTFLAGQHARNLYDLALSADGKTLLYNTSTASTPPQWFRARLDGAQIASPDPITDLNPSWKNRRFPRVELIRWKGAKDEEVEGLLYYPFDYQPGKRYPLVTGPHGGPASADYDQWNEESSYPGILHVQRGAFYFRPNYHGSTNYGLDFVESIGYGNYYDLEIPDIEKGVDALIARGLVDPDRIGAGGWSNGGILTVGQLVANPARYKAASVGAADVEYISDWGNTYFGHSGDAYYLGKTPFEDPAFYVKKSPFFQMGKVTTPTIIYTPTEDINVPPNQGWSHFRALQYFGKAPVKFVVFSGEPHSLRKLSHRIRKVEEDMAWFDRYLYKLESDKNEALKKGSPLDQALRTKKIAKTDDLYGLGTRDPATRKQIVIPEVVQRGDLEIGRFEVTRAQYASFDKNYFYEPGTGNHPANGITLDQARAYATWLSKVFTGIWRIPNESEAAALYEKHDGENTLDYWAGYAPNPDDVERIRSKLPEFARAAPLLKSAGSFAGQGSESEELIFDLGGNAAEWVLTRDGKGKVIGGSADCPADAKSHCTPAPEYVGFRVVRGAAQTEKR
jgi:dipeptidyl aminopeptidase/acylaminoacyl peptidase